MPLDVRQKLAILADAAKYDASCASGGGKSRRGDGPGLGSVEGMGICHSYTPDGRCVSLLKILLTNYCIYDCKYCVNRVSSDVQRARFTVDEVVWLTVEFYKRNYIEGLFLSSGIIQTPDYTMEQLVEVARKLRTEHRFRGYIHLKTIPGADDRLVALAGLHADRLSVNVELPTPRDLVQLAPEKKPDEIDAAMGEIHERRSEVKADLARGVHAPVFAPAGQSTQMIVGATDTPDADILATSRRLYAKHDLRRVYYSAFSPIPHADARLPGKSPPLVREHRLYQADWLLRFYGFDTEELTTVESPNLRLDLDPKTAWALRNLGEFPVDINVAPREKLLRVPGLGVRTVDRIIAQRKFRAVRTADLRALRVPLKRASLFLVTADTRGRKADGLAVERVEHLVRPWEQRSLFDQSGFPETGAAESSPESLSP